VTRHGTITCTAPAEAQAHGPLLVTIRNGDSDIVARGVTGAPISVPPGRYFAMVMMPDGREIGTHDAIAVASGADAECIAGVCSIEPPQHFDLRIAPAHAAPIASAPPMIGAAAPDISDVPATIWQGDWLALWDGSDLRPPPLPSASFALSASELRNVEGSIVGDRLLAFPVSTGRGSVIRFTALPYDLAPQGGITTPAILARLNLATGTPEIDFRTTSDEVNTLLSIVEANILTNMLVVTEELMKRQKAGISVAAVSIFGAITGCYILLRSNILDGVDTWLDQLEKIDPGLPDAVALRIELLARLGHHAEAVDLLRRSINGRSPWFRAGLSYLLERLRLYIDVTNNSDDPFSLSATDMELFKIKRNRLERLLPMMDNGRYIATFDIPERGAAS